ELRDILFKLGYQAYSIDINMDMFLAMQGLLKNASSSETIIKSDWLNNPLRDKYFDVVLGDAVLPNIPWKERNHLLKEVRRVLKPNGVYLTRAFYAPDKKRFKDVEAILQHFSGNKKIVQS